MRTVVGSRGYGVTDLLFRTEMVGKTVAQLPQHRRSAEGQYLAEELGAAGESVVQAMACRPFFTMVRMRKGACGARGAPADRGWRDPAPRRWGSDRGAAGRGDAGRHSHFLRDLLRVGSFDSKRAERPKVL